MPTKRIWLSLLTFVVITIVSAVTILYARGWQLSPHTGGVVKTGLLVVGSQPDGAVVYLDGHLTSATNTTISYLLPKNYHVRITKEGYLPWEKTVEVKPELVTKIEAVLWPVSPELKPLTYTGVHNPTLSPDGQKLAYTVTAGLKTGVWVMDLADRPFLLSRDPRQLVADTPNGAVSNGLLEWSPDSRQVLVRITDGGEPATRTYLLDSERANQSLLDVTPTIHATLSLWSSEIKQREEARLQRLEEEHLRKFATFKLIEEATPSVNSGQAPSAMVPHWQFSSQATSSAKLPVIPTPTYRIVWSPNETRALLLPHDGTQPRVYDLKTRKMHTIPEALAYAWYPEQPDSRHLVLIKEKGISIVEFDGANETQVYTGQFDNGYVFPWPTGGRLVILTSYNAGAGTLANLYSVNLR